MSEYEKLIDFLSNFKIHPLQAKRMNLERWYNKEREKLDSEYQDKLKNIQDECTHCWEDGSSACDQTSAPFSEIYCVICNK